MPEQTIEEKAKSMGHVPKEEWKGDPDKWRPAEEFVERGENIIPILKKRLDTFEKKFEQSESDNKIIIAANKREVEEAKKIAYDTAKADYDAKIAKLDEKELDALVDSDKDGVKKIRQQKKNLKEPDKPKPVETPATKNPVFEDWSKQNKWYSEDTELAEEMKSQANVLNLKYPVDEHPEITDKEIFKMAADNVKKLHPDKFKNSRRNDPGAVETGTGTPSDTKDKTYAALPASAKTAYARLAKDFKTKGRDYKKEDYARDYWE